MEATTARPRRRPWAFRSAWLVPVPVLVLYGIWLFANYGPGHDPRDAVVIGRQFVERSTVSSVIKPDPSYSYPAGQYGYDGEFVYFIALDPVNARYYVDTPNYRYTRILYPLLARALALGRPAAIPYVLLIINWLAIAGGTLALALWLRRRGVWPWFALAYGLYPGLFIVLKTDTTEALAYALTALGVLLWDYRQRWGVLPPAGIFALAALTRETTIVFPILYALGLVIPSMLRPERRSWRVLATPALVIGVAVLPLILYKAFLYLWLGSQGDPGLLLDPVPFRGLIRGINSPGWVEEVRTVVIPGLICAGVSLYAVWKRWIDLEPVVFLVNCLLFLVLLPWTSYLDISSSGRITTAVVLAAILAAPALIGRLGTATWLWASSALWLALTPFWLLIPVLQYLAHLAHKVVA